MKISTKHSTNLTYHILKITVVIIRDMTTQILLFLKTHHLTWITWWGLKRASERRVSTACDGQPEPVIATYSYLLDSYSFLFFVTSILKKINFLWCHTCLDLKFGVLVKLLLDKKNPSKIKVFYPCSQYVKTYSSLQAIVLFTSVSTLLTSKASITDGIALSTFGLEQRPALYTIYKAV